MKVFCLCLISVVVGCMATTMPCSLPLVMKTMDLQNATCCVCCRQSKLAGTCVGNGLVVTCEFAELASVLQQSRCVDGISLHFDGNLQKFHHVVQKLQLEVYCTQQIGGAIVLVGHSKQIAGGVQLDGRLVNVQMAFANGKISVGSPLLLCDY
ncbi:MAG: hypothetical protein IKC52_01580 [Clostridia bacterium]|nr:hypothetical protein [Clostridia bacterium]